MRWQQQQKPALHSDLQMMREERKSNQLALAAQFSIAAAAAAAHKDAFQRSE
jgi:hypothetical protein